MKDALYSVCLMLLLCTVAISGTTGKLAGRVTDRQSGEPVVGANVLIKGTALGASTDTEGYYFIINIPPGSYEVLLSCIGYQRVTYRGAIQVDQTTTLDVRMTPGSVDLDEVVVEAARVVIQRDQSSTVQRTNADELAAMPVNSIAAVLQLQTGVVNTGALHIRGGRSGEVGYYLDGYRVEDPLFNGAVLEVNNQAIQEMELLSGTFNAEYGNALSGVVNVVTKESEGRMRANLSYKRTKLGIEGPSNDLNERYLEGTVSGPLWNSSPLSSWCPEKRWMLTATTMRGERRRIRPVNARLSSRRTGHSVTTTFSRGWASCRGRLPPNRVSRCSTTTPNANGGRTATRSGSFPTVPT